MEVIEKRYLTVPDLMSIHNLSAFKVTMIARQYGLKLERKPFLKMSVDEAHKFGAAVAKYNTIVGLRKDVKSHQKKITAANIKIRKLQGIGI